MYRSRFAFSLAMAALAALLLPSPLPAQITFERTYGGRTQAEGLSVQQTADSGYIIAGFTVAPGVPNVYLVKTDANGDTVWTRAYAGGLGMDMGWSVQQTTDGGYVVAGYTYAGSNSDVYLSRTDANGETLWTRTYGGSASDRGCSVQQTADSGYVIAGYTGSFGAGSADAWLIKTNADGSTMWTETYGGADFDYGQSVQQTPDGGYILVGLTFSFGTGNADVYLIKTDAQGDTLWTRTYGGTASDYGYSVQQTKDGGYIVAGHTESYGAGGWDVYVIRTDAHGDTVWTRTYGGAGDDQSYSVRQTADGGYILAGWTASYGVGSYDVYLINIDAQGDAIWTRSFGGDTADCARSVQQTLDGGYVIAGWTYSLGPGYPAVYLIKTDGGGCVAAAEPKASPTRAPALTLSCEPNPFRTRTAISLQLTADGPAELAVFDAAGRRVRSLSSPLSPPSSLTWDGTDKLGHALPSGTYFVRVDAKGEHVTTRVALQR